MRISYDMRWKACDIYVRQFGGEVTHHSIGRSKILPLGGNTGVSTGILPDKKIQNGKSSPSIDQNQDFKN